MGGIVKVDSDFIFGAPTEFTQAERDTFIQLVCAGGEVGNQLLGRNVANAKALIFLKQEQGHSLQGLYYPIMPRCMEWDLMLLKQYGLEAWTEQFIVLNHQQAVFLS